MGEILIPTMVIDDRVQTTVTPIIGTCMTGANDQKRRENDENYKGLIDDLHFNYLEEFGGSTSAWAHVNDPPGDGYEIDTNEVEMRGKDIDRILNGVGAKTHGYSFWQDLVDIMPYVTMRAKIVANMISPLIGVPYPYDFSKVDVSRLIAEIKRKINDLIVVGINTIEIQLGYELSIGGNEDIFQKPEDYRDLCNLITPIIRTEYPGIKISGDTPPVDEKSGEWGEAVAGIDVDAWRQYFQFDGGTWDELIARTGEFHSFLDTYQRLFPGKKMNLSQVLLKMGSQYKSKIGEAVLYSKMLIEVAKENVSRTDLITGFNIGSADRFIGTTEDTVFPLYYYTKVMRNMMRNAKAIDVSFSNTPGSENLFSFAVRKYWGGTRVYVVNQSSEIITVDSVTLNGTQQTIKVDSVFGTRLADDSVQTYYADNLKQVKFNQYSITKVSFR